MRTRHVIRYYCDFCSRGYFKKTSMAKHESGCTANPNRVCGLCAYAIPQLTQRPIGDLVACLTAVISLNLTTEEGMAKLRDIAQQCPGCILAAIRQSGIMKALYDSEYGPPDMKFDFKKELQAWWAQTHTDGIQI